MLTKVLVANRGEIAKRIFIACRELGIPCVAIYSTADADAPWSRAADERVHLPGVTATETYLNQTAVIAAAKSTGADAIHPGYGFLSENADFAELCHVNDITFIGPSPEAMRMLGSKAAARILAQKAGVPVVPGVDGAGQTDLELQAAATAIGYPILIKASAGGGGKGMRVVWSADEFLDAVQAARQESQSSFGSDHLLIEKYFTEIHHVEIQVLGDAFGNLIHLFERECSVQRRHQKIIEESPAPIIQDEGLRHDMAAAAVALAKSVNYMSAGTLEFIVDGNGRYYFLEMNTRLQVEHPVTEAVTGLDLAAWQIRIAAGEPLPITQEQIRQRGHAIECRIYAEDPANHFLPYIGQITTYHAPSGPGVRVDDGLETGSQVTPYYDPMLAKVITWGYDRPEAIRKMIRALQEMVVLGVTTNISYLLAILQEENFIKGLTSTNYLKDNMADWPRSTAVTEIDWLAIGAWELLQSSASAQPVAVENGRQPDPWNETTAWRNV